MPSHELFQQAVLLRRIQGIVLTDVYLSPRPGEDPEDASSRIHNEIDIWYEGLPHKVSLSSDPHPYFEVNYHLLLTRLYSPSPLIRQTTSGRMRTLRESSYKVIEMYGSMQEEHRVQRNHITLSQLASACTALVYTISERESVPGNIKLASWRRRALNQLESAERLFAGFCSQSAHADIYSNAFVKLTSGLKAKLNEQAPDVTHPRWVGRTSFSGQTPRPDVPVLGMEFKGPTSNGSNGPETTVSAVDLHNPLDDPSVSIPWSAWLQGTPSASPSASVQQNPSSIDSFLPEFNFGTFAS